MKPWKTLLLPAALLAAALPALHDAQEPTEPAEDAESAEPTEPAGPFDLRVLPLVELFHEVRARAETPAEEEPEDDLLDGAVEAARVLVEELGPLPSARFLEGYLLDCEDANKLQERFQRLPEQTPRGAGGEPLALQDTAIRLAEELSKVESTWRERVWPERQVQLEAAAERLGAILNGPAGAAILADVARELDLAAPREPLAIHLVTRAPRPGAITLRAANGPTSFVAVDGLADSLAIEIIVHEALHALDALTEERGSLPSRLRTALEAAGVSARSEAHRNAVHALFFVAAGALVRRHVDADHEDYGVTRGVYEQLAPWSKLWQELLPELAADPAKEGDVVARVVAAAGKQG